MNDQFSKDLASSSPTPGGGAAAARSGAHASSLIRMVCSITLERGKPEEPLRAELQSIDRRAADLTGRFAALELEDMAAFESFLEAMRLPKSDEAEKAARRQAMRAAAKRATDAPIATLESALGVLELASELSKIAEEHRLRAEADVGSAVEIAAGAFHAAEWNVRVNLSSLGDERERYEEKHRVLAESFGAQYAKLKACIANWF